MSEDIGMTPNPRQGSGFCAGGVVVGFRVEGLGVARWPGGSG
jgi:hypothetical protein